MKQLFCGAAALVILLASCDKNDDDSNSISSTDQDFMVKASYSNWAEVGAGSIAAIKGNADSVKMFGSMMVADHTNAETSLDSVAKAYSITIPSEPDDAHKAKAAYLQTLSGYMFDTAYINAQVIDHQATVALFQQESSKGNNSTVKAFVATHLPVIQMHLQEALDIQAQLK